MNASVIKRVASIAAVATLTLSLTGCWGRIPTGYTGVRSNFDQTVNMTPVSPGWYWEGLDTVTAYVTNEITLPVENIPAQAKDRSFVKDFDVVVRYQVNGNELPQLQTQFSRRHKTLEDGTIFPFGLYIETITKSIAPKSVEPIDALNLAENRSVIEESIRKDLIKQLKVDHLEGKVDIQSVLVKTILPDDRLTASNLSVLEAQRAKERRQIEIETAQLESERAAKLLSKGDAYLKLREVEISGEIVKAIQEGKVNTIVVPHTFTSVNAATKSQPNQ